MMQLRPSKEEGSKEEMVNIWLYMKHLFPPLLLLTTLKDVRLFK